MGCTLFPRLFLAKACGSAELIYLIHEFCRSVYLNQQVVISFASGRFPDGGMSPPSEEVENRVLMTTGNLCRRLLFSTAHVFLFLS